MKKLIVVFSGAGLSAESGIPTFRASNGLWENHKIEDVASPQGWQKNPKLVLDFYNQRRGNIKGVKPNAAHLAIASLQSHFEVINITQNIDDLLERAGCEKVWHLHGSILRKKCEHHEDISSGKNYFCTYKAAWESAIKFGENCPLCGGQLRPDIVWFGEAVDLSYANLEDLIQNAFAFIGVGTSAQVYPAAGLIPAFAKTKHLYFIDPNPAYEVLKGYEVMAGKAAELFPELAERLVKMA